MSAPRRGSAGFSLLEVLLAITLLALLLTGAMSGIRTATRAMHAGEQNIERTNRLRVAQEFIRRELGRSLPLAFGQEHGSGANFVFQGEKDFLRFVAPMPGHLARGGPHVQWLTFVSERDGMRLEFDHAQLNGYDPDNPKGDSEREPVTLIDGIRDGRFEFRELDEQGELGDWDTSWDDPQRLPLLVRLVLEFDEASRKRWPDLEIPVLTATAVPGLFNARRLPGSDGLDNPQMPQPTPEGGG